MGRARYLKRLRWPDGWLRGVIHRVWLRTDAGFPAPGYLDALEKEGFPYVCRLRSDAAPERMAQPFIEAALCRPAEEHRWIHELSYRAGTWEKPRRLVLVITVNPGPQGGLFLNHFFLLSSVSADTEG